MIESVQEALEVFRAELRDLKKFADTNHLPTREMTVEGLRHRYCAVPDYVHSQIVERIVGLKAMAKVLKLTPEDVERIWGEEGLSPSGEQETPAARVDPYGGACG